MIQAIRRRGHLRPTRDRRLGRRSTRAKLPPHLLCEHLYLGPRRISGDPTAYCLRRQMLKLRNEVMVMKGIGTPFREVRGDEDLFHAWETR